MTWESQPIVPPWKGVVDNIPSIVAPPSSFSSATGFWIDKQRLKTFLTKIGVQVPPNLGVVIGLRTFTDAVGNLHTIFVTPTQAYFFVPPAAGYYDSTGIPASKFSLTPISFEVYQNVLFLTNGSDKILAIDGSAYSSSQSLPNNGTSFFLGKIAGRLLALNLVEPQPSQLGSTNYPRRFRWSAVNDATNWTAFDAGVADISEIEDNITGYATQGALGYIYRNKGVTVITPTGSISPTFFLENYSGGEQGVGVGCFFPYSLAQFGNMTVFAAEDDIYMFNPLLGPFQAIGGSATRSIYLDLQKSTGYCIGALLPTLTYGITSLQYWLIIPLAASAPGEHLNCKVWIYSFESQTWMSQLLPYVITCIANVAVS